MSAYREPDPPATEQSTVSAEDRWLRRRRIVAGVAALLFLLSFPAVAIWVGGLGAVVVLAAAAVIGVIGQKILVFSEARTPSAFREKLARETEQFLRSEEDAAIRSRVFLLPSRSPADEQHDGQLTEEVHGQRADEGAAPVDASPHRTR